MRPLKKSQRLRVVANGVSFYTTAGQVADGVGDQMWVNLACRKALVELNRIRTADAAVGLAGTWDLVQVQLSMI